MQIFNSLLLQKIRHLSLNHDLTTLEANKPLNRVLNRYRDVLPYDHSRVVLWDCEATDYINASLVEVSHCPPPSHTSCVTQLHRSVYKSHWDINQLFIQKFPRI